MPWVIAILIALVVIAASGALALGNLTERARADLADAVTVQIVEADPARKAAMVQTAAQVLRKDPWVTSVRVVPERELEELLEPWLGEAAAQSEVPMPALIDVELSGRASAEDISALETRLEAAGAQARIDAQSEWLRPVYDALAALQYLALALIVLVALATAAAVWLAARNAFVNHREVVEIVHLLGGTDRQVTRIFERSVLRDAIFGATFGAALGLAAIIMLGAQFSALDGGLIAGARFGIGDWVAIALVPAAGIMLALVTARITISGALRVML
jgi:cell division transport system permease protein